MLRWISAINAKLGCIAQGNCATISIANVSAESVKQKMVKLFQFISQFKIETDFVNGQRFLYWLRAITIQSSSDDIQQLGTVLRPTVRAIQPPPNIKLENENTE